MTYELSDEEKVELNKMLEENNSWEQVFKELYAEYDIAAYMSDFCYLYYETECYNMVEVVETRRYMLGLSRVKLADGICSDKTIIRFEREGRTPSIEVFRCLFERMGMCAEYRRAKIITTDATALLLYYNGVVKMSNDRNGKIGLDGINELKAKIRMDIPYNQQELIRLENIHLYDAGEIGADEFANNVIKALECTVKTSSLINDKKKCLTVAEMECVSALAFEVKTEISEVCLEIIEEICFDAMENGVNLAMISLLELLMGKMACRLGDEKRYDESCKMSGTIAKECLSHYRMEDLTNTIYNKVWNYQQAGFCDNSFIATSLRQCVILSQIVKKYNVTAFFQRKQEEYSFY